MHKMANTSLVKWPSRIVGETEGAKVYVEPTGDGVHFEVTWQSKSLRTVRGVARSVEEAKAMVEALLEVRWYFNDDGQQSCDLPARKRPTQ